MKNTSNERIEFYLKAAPYISGALSFIVYCFTIAPSVIQIDSGELAAAQYLAGIAHPTGYPLFTMLGFLFSRLPLPFTIIFKLNLLAAFWCSLSIFIFNKALIKFLSSLAYSPQRRENPKKRKASTLQETKSHDLTRRSFLQETKFSKPAVLTASLIGTLFLAFSRTFWFQSTSVEVYSLQLALFALIIYFTIDAFFKTTTKWSWIPAAISVGLGFANHMTTLLIIPFVVWLFIRKEGIRRDSLKRALIAFAAATVTAGLFYIYLPLRASSVPLINWGDPSTAENFWRHVTGKQYQVWLFSSFDSAVKQIGYYFSILPQEFGYSGLLIALPGIFFLWRHSKFFASVLYFTFVFAVIYASNYDIVDIDSYFLLSFMIFSLFIALGIAFLLEKYPARNLYRSIFTIALLLFPMALNFAENDQSDNYIFEDYTKSILRSVEKESVILSYQWDYFISPSYYFQIVDGYKKDVAVIDKELLRRSWYYKQLAANYPAAVAKIKNEIDGFVNAVTPFERGEDYYPAFIEKNYRNVIKKIVETNRGNSYLGIELVQNELRRGEIELPEGASVVPHLLLFKITYSNDYVECPPPDFEIRRPANENKYTRFIDQTVPAMLSYRALYELSYGKMERAKIFVSKIRKDYPKFVLPRELLAGLNQSGG